MGLVEEVQQRLIDQSVGGNMASTEAWKITHRELVPSPDTAIAVVPTGGGTQFAVADNPLDRPTFQVMVRAAANSSTGLEQKVNDVITALNLYSGTPSTGGAEYVDIQKEGDALYLGRDENQRPVYSLNFRAIRERTT
jgi:hypothetical protein